MSGHHTVAVAVLRRDGRVLLCHRHADRAWYPDCWDLPGGHVEEGEDALAAVVRECAEEIGVRLRAPAPVPVEVLDPTVTMHAYVADDWDGEVTNLAPEEHDAIGWFTAAELAGLDLADPVYLTWLADLLHPPGPSRS